MEQVAAEGTSAAPCGAAASAAAAGAGSTMELVDGTLVAAATAVGGAKRPREGADDTVEPAAKRRVVKAAASSGAIDDHSGDAGDDTSGVAGVEVAATGGAGTHTLAASTAAGGAAAPASGSSGASADGASSTTRLVFVKVCDHQWVRLDPAADVLAMHHGALLEALRQHKQLGECFLDVSVFVDFRVHVIRGPSDPAQVVPDLQSAMDDAVEVLGPRTVGAALKIGGCSGEVAWIVVRPLDCGRVGPGFSPALLQFKAPTAYRTALAVAKAAKWPRSSTLPNVPEYLAARIMGDRVGLYAPPVPVELMDTAFLDFQDDIAAPPDVAGEAYAKAGAAAAAIASIGETREDEYSSYIEMYLNQLVDHDYRLRSTALGLAGEGPNGAVASYDEEDDAYSGYASDSPARAPHYMASGYQWTAVHLDVRFDDNPATQNDVQACLHAPFVARGGRLCVNRKLAAAMPNHPFFLVDVYAGRHLEVRGGAWAGPALCTTLLASAPLQGSGGSHALRQLTHLLHALAKGWTRLAARYRAALGGGGLKDAVILLEAPKPAALISRSIVDRLPCGGGSLSLEHRASGRGRVFSAVATSMVAAKDALAADSTTSAGAAAAAALPRPSVELVNRPVIVKFCRVYDAEVHAHVASRGHAPALLSVTAVGGGWQAIVMDRLGSDWHHPNGREAAVAALAAYDRAFTTADGKRLVHGDPRNCNILVRGRAPDSTMTPPIDVMFIDFEFAGVEGEVRYPSYLSRDAFSDLIYQLYHDEQMDAKAPVSESGTVLGGRPILQKHDQVLMRRWGFV